MSAVGVRDRLAGAAFDLFDERGYEQTTVDEIAERAGVGRTTFFRHYRSKEDVIFPDHDALIAAIRARLAVSSADTALLAVSDAIRLVLLSYVGEGDHARRRYAITSRVAPLRDREIVTVARYQRLFREHIAASMEPGAGAALRAELMAAAVVATHNHVLRRWLRGEVGDAVGELDAAMLEVLGLFTRDTGAGDRAGSTVVVLRGTRSQDQVVAALRQVLGPAPTSEAIYSESEHVPVQ